MQSNTGRPDIIPVRVFQHDTLVSSEGEKEGKNSVEPFSRRWLGGGGEYHYSELAEKARGQSGSSTDLPFIPGTTGLLHTR